MKRLFLPLLMAATLAGCECKDGYGPNDCDVPWSSNYAGTWSGTAECTGTGQNHTFEIEDMGISADGVRNFIIDGGIRAELGDWDGFRIPEQIVYIPELNENMTVSGQGALIETSTLVGYITMRTTKLQFSMTQAGSSQTITCDWLLEKTSL